MNKVNLIIKLLKEKISKHQIKQSNKKTICESCGQNNRIFAGNYCAGCWDDLECHLRSVKCVKIGRINYE